jgi:LacI family transcriptional regulator
LRTALETRGLRTVLVTDAANDRLTLDALTDGSYDGIILTTTLRKSPLPRDLSERQVPHVLVNRVVDNAISPSCAIDNTLGARAVADLLVTLKHRRIGSLQGPLATSTGRERASALATALRSHGLHTERALTRRVPFDHNAAFNAVLDMLQDQRPTAIACGNDVIAMGVLSTAHHLELAVPRELTIIGFDDIPMSSWLWSASPPCTVTLKHLHRARSVC